MSGREWMLSRLHEWRGFIVRDAVLTLTAVAAVLFADGTSGTAAFAAGTVVGIAAYLFHEWAHLLGALLARAEVSRPERLFAPFLFSFDSEKNSLSQFLAMTLPGFVATAIYITVFLLFLPEGEPWAQVALIAGVLLASATVIIEGPIAVWAIVTGEVPAVEIPFIGNNRILAGILERIDPS